MAGQGQHPQSKRAWRARLVAARRAVPGPVRVAEASALVTAALALPGDPVCCHLPIGTEPGSIDLVTGLAAQGRRILLPVVVGAAPLDWGTFDGVEALVAGPYGLREPGGPRLGAHAIATAELVLVPALAVDLAGRRLGKGGGHYDRSLPLAKPGTPLVAVVRDDEVVPELPAEPHDVPMTAALTPIVGLRSLG